MACAICDDTGWKTIEVDGVARVSRCDCWRERTIQQYLASARIPRRYQQCDLSNFDTGISSHRQAHQKITRFIEQFPVVDRGLLLHGDHGVGKTHLAVALLKDVIRLKGARGLFYETRDLLKLVRDTYTTQSEATELEVLRPVFEAELLVLDDIGSEKKSEWVEETLGLVINTRYSERRVTVITTNLQDLTDDTHPNSIMFKLGGRIRSRLFEMCDWIHLDTVDIREVGPHPTPDDIARWQERSPASPKNKGRGMPARTSGQLRAQLKSPEKASRVDLKWPGGRAGS
ncbi:MAG: ATP-binding protein [Acidobacteria bacterium]|nr:ATP-binding protein [Acidobacteriota bacterium]